MVESFKTEIDNLTKELHSKEDLIQELYKERNSTSQTTKLQDSIQRSVESPIFLLQEPTCFPKHKFDRKQSHHSFHKSLSQERVIPNHSTVNLRPQSWVVQERPSRVNSFNDLYKPISNRPAKVVFTQWGNTVDPRQKAFQNSFAFNQNIIPQQQNRTQRMLSTSSSKNQLIRHL